MHDLDHIPAVLGGRPAFPDGPPAWPPAWPEVKAALDSAFADGTWGRYHGPHVSRLEAKLCELFDTPQTITCASGTLAVEVALRAVGVGPGDEVILAAYDYEANFLTVHAIGAQPVLVDVAERNWNLDPARLAAAITPATKAIVCSHLHGGLIPMPEVRAVAESHGISVIEDAAQAPGAILHDRPVGAWGHIGTLSFGGSKLLTAGRGGAVLFRDSRHFQRAKVWLSRGVQQWAMLSELQAAILLPQLDRLQYATDLRTFFVRRLVDKLHKSGIPGLCPLFEDTEQARPAFYKLGFQYDPTVFGLSREQFVTALRAEGIAWDPGFVALHVGRSPTRYRAVSELKNATAAHHHCVILHHPILLGDPEMTTRILDAIEKTYRNRDPIRTALRETNSV
jgi:perosamine synthetase